MKYLIFLIFIFSFNTNANAQLSNQEKKEFLKYSKRECPSNMLKKSASDPRYSSAQFLKLRKEIGNNNVKNQILKPAFKAYCDCFGTSIYSGDSISAASKTCGTYIQYELRKGLSKFGYF